MGEENCMNDHFYCQLDYEAIPYALPGGHGNLADSGCGICATSMLVERMLDVSCPPEEAVKLALFCGARDKSGTNYYILGGAVSAKFSLRMACTEDLNEALALMKAHAGAKTVANIRGNREGYVGLFSDCGHYVLLDRLRDDQVCVLDSMYKPESDRYAIPGRAGKVRMNGNEAWCDQRLLALDCYERPYFVFWRA